MIHESKLLEAFVERDHIFFVMEYCEGGYPYRLIRPRNIRGGGNCTSSQNLCSTVICSPTSYFVFNHWTNVFNHKNRRLTFFVSKTLNGRLPLKQGSYRPETCTQHVSGYPQHLIFIAGNVFFWFVPVLEILRTSFWSGFIGLPPHPAPPPPPEEKYRNLGKVIRIISD